MEEIDESILIEERKKFDSEFGELSETETLKELLFTQKLTLSKIEEIRGKASILVLFLVTIPYIFGAICLVLFYLNSRQ